MPTASEILAGLARIANDAFALAIVWHAAVAFALAALVAGWRPTYNTARALLALPLASASALAFRFGNPFNGALLAIASVVLVAAADRAVEGRVTLGGPFFVTAGAASVTFAFAYPHFLEGRSVWAYLVGSPMGLVPCPTLALVIGVALLLGGIGSRPLSLLLAAYGLFYGIVGIVQLGVTLDAGLVAAALALAALALVPRAMPQVLRRPRTR